VRLCCAVSYTSDQCSRDGNGQTAKDGDAAVTRGKKRTPSDMKRRSNKCFRGDVSPSDAAAAAVDDDGDDECTDRCDVESSAEVSGGAEDAQPEMTNSSQSDAIDTNTPTPEVDSIPVSPLLTEVLHESDTPTSDLVALTASIYDTTDVTMTSSELPLPVMSSNSYSTEPRSSVSSCSNVAATANTYCDDKDVTVTSSKLLPVASLTVKTACSSSSTFVPSGTSTVGAVVRLPEASMPRVLHSAAGLFPFPVPMTISQQAPFVVGRSTVTLRPSVVPLATPRWLPVPHVAPSPQYQSLRLISPMAIFTDCFQKQHVTGCYGPGSPQMGYHGASPGDCGCPSGIRASVSSQKNSAQVHFASQPLSRSSLVNSHQSAPTCQSSSQQVPAHCKSTASSDEVIAKLDPVSRAVYDNFLGKLRTTTKQKTGTGKRRGHTNDVTRRYRN